MCVSDSVCVCMRACICMCVINYALKMGCHTWVKLWGHGLLYFSTHMYMSVLAFIFHNFTHTYLPGVLVCWTGKKFDLYKFLLFSAGMW